MNGKGQKFALVLTLDCKLPLESISEEDPAINIEVVLVHEATDNARHAKVQTWVQLDIHQVLMPWQDITGIASLHKVNARNVIAFKEYELIF